MNRNTFLLVFSALIIGIGFNSFYIVNEKQNAIVLQFGEAVRSDIPVDFISNSQLSKK
jgi:regulator of protease activity HflC (stomatin/prohibitin superfamily)